MKYPLSNTILEVIVKTEFFLSSGSRDALHQGLCETQWRNITGLKL